MKPKALVLAGVVVAAAFLLGVVAARRRLLLDGEMLPVINSPERRAASTHPLQYYISLPPGWSKTRTWPVVVAIPGSGKNWVSSANAYAAVRDARRYPFIIVTPIVATNGGRDLRSNPAYTYAPSVWDRVDREGRCTFDREGFSAVMADVARDYNGQAKPFLTGYSGGGHFSVAEMLVHPELLRAAGLSAVNYSGRCVDGPTTEAKPDFIEPSTPPGISTSPARVTLPVRFFLGTDDPYAKYLAPQRDNAIRDATSHGFANVSSTTVRRTGHEAMIAIVLDYFDSLLDRSER